METHKQYPLTLVTAYFELGGRPPFSGVENPYPRWIRNFLPYIKWPLVIFCDEQSVEMLKEARGGKPAVWHVTHPEEFYAYRYLNDLKRLTFAAKQVEGHIALGLVWHEKHQFLRQALSENPFGSEMLFWCDIGVFRWESGAPLLSSRRAFRLFEDTEWPNLGVCRELPQDKVVLFRSYCNIMHGAVFGGAIEPSRRWCDAYYRRLEGRKQEGRFTDREEFIMMGCWRRQPELAHVLFPDAAPWPAFVAYLFRFVGRTAHYFKWYLLSGRRFPWKHIFRRIFIAPRQGRALPATEWKRTSNIR